MALLKVTAVKAGFGPTTVLHGLDLAVEPHELTAILGLNGAGKSVTLKVVGGQVPAWEGKVVFDGEDITGLGVEQRVARGMGFVPQGRQLFPELTVEENLRLGGYLPRRRDRAASERKAAQLLERFPRLAERRSQAAGTMSGGEQAMLAVARALMSDPKLLLVDEPSAGLAPVIATQVFDLLREVHREGVAVLLVEQNVPLALSVADRINVMQRGRVSYATEATALDHDRLAAELGIGRLLTRSVKGRSVEASSPATTNGARKAAGTRTRTRVRKATT